MTERQNSDADQTRGREPRAKKKPSMARVIRGAVQQFGELTGKQADGVSGVRREGEGWSLLVDVVELERIPSTTTVIATYRLDVTADGELDGYERLRRYVRGSVDPS
ncbi:Gas vesicle synthesis protein GvpO [Actinopolymorpha cephalotaxi]|uniref:Gas vesicle synthesis protein GvpO n=1 Tax=Actinopolymorpha cephalotaxi TaxID=504797 RepID=A0A1I2PIN5_9ACTN|nr:gas vesicle protein [Actinopolymorpha cephalotaxi]NYH83623.1 hypothetical protein [Actinopolymorpha cephalotaxi]SFG14959.1 Gas vesicle synthesis protein GvpO [Actinopolymorpha cephalotaxi]